MNLHGAENETRTRDPNLGKVVLYQLSYFRIGNNMVDYKVSVTFYQKIPSTIWQIFFAWSLVRFILMSSSRNTRPESG